MLTISCLCDPGGGQQSGSAGGQGSGPVGQRSLPRLRQHRGGEGKVRQNFIYVYATHTNKLLPTFMGHQHILWHHNMSSISLAICF